MAWPRIKNSRSSAQPGAHPHNGVQVTVTPVPDAEPAPGTGQNTGVSGTTHAVAYEDALGAPSQAADGFRVGRRLRPIRYGHAANNQRATRTAAPPTAARSSDVAPPAGEMPPTGAPVSGIAPPTPAGVPLAGTVVSGALLPDPDSGDDQSDDYDGTAGLVYEASRPPYDEPAYTHEEPARDEDVPNEGLGIFGGVATTEVPEDEEPTRELEEQQVQPPAPAHVIPIGAAWNQPIASIPVAGDETEDRKPNPFGRLRGILLGGGQPADDREPRANVRDLPPDVQMSFIRDRVIIVLVVGVLSFIVVRSWPLSITLMIIAFVLDMVRRQRTAAQYVNGGAHPGARKATSKQLRKMRRDGYFTLDARPIPDSREYIDHLVIGPTGVYAIDSERWNPKLPIRTWNGKKLYHGPESQKARLEHAVWEASQASELLSGALGFEVKVRPALAIYGPKIPWDIATIRNVDVFTGSALRKYLKSRKRSKDGVPLTREEVQAIYDAATRVLPDVAEAYSPVS